MINELVIKGKNCAQSCHIPAEVIEKGVTNHIFTCYPTKIGKVSFGGEMIRFFVKTEVGVKVYLQMQLINAEDSLRKEC